jgi:predicted permease
LVAITMSHATSRGHLGEVVATSIGYTGRGPTERLLLAGQSTAVVISVFVDVLLPVVLIAGIGGTVAHHLRMPVAPLAGLTFEVFSPALVFDALQDVRAGSGTIGRIVIVIVVGFAVLTAASVLWSRSVQHDRPTLAASALSAAVANMGNMGLPVTALAFGEAGLEVAVVAFVASSVLTYSGGVVIASYASGSVRDAIRAPLRVPALWAALAALGVRFGDISLPSAVDQTTSALAGAAIPCMLVVLGLQVREHSPALDKVRVAAVPIGLRLCVSPAIAAGLTTVVGLDGVGRRTLIVLGGMPTAVNATILASQYRARPALVTQAVVASTVLSVASLTALVSLLRQ